MDYCCEPQVAQGRAIRLLRMAATVALYYKCRSVARNWKPFNLKCRFLRQEPGKKRAGCPSK